MEQRNSFVVIVLAAILGSAAIAPRWSIPELTPPSAALTQSEEGSLRRSKTLLRARNAKGLIEEFFSGRINLKNPSDSDDFRTKNARRSVTAISCSTQTSTTNCGKSIR